MKRQRNKLNLSDSRNIDEEEELKFIEGTYIQGKQCNTTQAHSTNEVSNP